jgi:hypothetical protein
VSRSEGLFVPQVQVDHIETAIQELEPKPFLMLQQKQRYLRRWMLRQIEKHDLRLVRAGQKYPVLAIQDEAVIAYGAMQHAFHDEYKRDLPRVGPSTIVDYFQELCPRSQLHPETHEPLDPVNSEMGETIRRDFADQQPYLAAVLIMRFGYTDAMASVETFVGMAHAMINNQLALPPGSQNDGH